MKTKFISILIYFLYFCFDCINCSSDRKKRFGKCVYFSTETGSKIINFYKYRNRDYYLQNKSYSINICNDTHYNITNNNGTSLRVESQIVYYKNSNESVRLAGPFNKINENLTKSNFILNKTENEDEYKYTTSYGDFCDNSDDNSTSNYSSYIIFEHKNEIEGDNIEITKFPEPDSCNPVLKLSYNKEYATDYLLLQKVLNNCYIFTGLVFIIAGIYLSFLSFKFQSITKIVISIVFGELFMFNIDLIFIGNLTALEDYLFILIILLGLALGIGLFFLIHSYEKVFFIISSFSAGYVCGIFAYEIFFFKTNSALSRSILIDALLIFTTSFIGWNLIIPRNYIYYPPFVGSYILIRGFSLFIYNISDKGGFGDLHLLLYLIKLQEQDLVYEYLENDYKYFYIYLIFIGLVLIAGEVIIFLKNKNDRELSFSELEDDDVEVSFISMNKLTEQ